MLENKQGQSNTYTRDCDLTRSTSARRRGDDGFDSWLKTASELKTIKHVPCLSLFDAREV